METKRSASRLCCVSQCHKYFAYCGVDHTVRIWKTSQGKLKHEFSPAKHLATPVTCMAFASDNFSKKSGCLGGVVALGTAAGRLLLYDWSAEKLVKDLEVSTVAVTDITWQTDTVLIVLSLDNTLALWDIVAGVKQKQLQVRGHETLCVLDGGVKEVGSAAALVAVAGQSIEVLDVSEGATKQVLHKFVGHASETTCLAHLYYKNTTYIVSASHNDTFVSLWPLRKKESRERGKHRVAEYSVKAQQRVAAVTVIRSFLLVLSTTGRLRIFRLPHDLMEDKTFLEEFGSLTIYEDAMHKIIRPIIQTFKSDDNITIVYATGACLFFEKLDVKSVKGRVTLVRTGRPEMVKRQGVAELQKINFVTPGAVSRVKSSEPKRVEEHQSDGLEQDGPAVKKARKNNSKLTLTSEDKESKDLPFETRLQAVTAAAGHGAAAHRDGTAALRNRSQAQLLLQGLQSNDAVLLSRVLINKNEDILQATVANLPSTAVVPLLHFLHTRLPLNWHKNRSYTMWCREVLQQHSSFLSSLPGKDELLRPFLQYSASRGAALPQLLRLRVRLDLLVNSVKTAAAGVTSADFQAEAAQHRYMALLRAEDESSDDDERSSASDDDTREISDIDTDDDDSVDADNNENVVDGVEYEDNDEYSDDEMDTSLRKSGAHAVMTNGISAESDSEDDSGNGQESESDSA